MRINSSGTGMRKTVIVETEEAHACKLGYAFVVSSNISTLSNTASHLFLWLKNTSATKDLHFKVAAFGWNGGSTNKNKVMNWGWLLGSSEPTANHTETTAGNLNFKSPNPAEALIYALVGVGHGMSYSGGIVATEMLLALGYTDIELDGVPLLGQNDYLGMVITGEEIGDAVVSLLFYYKDKT